MRTTRTFVAMAALVAGMSSCAGAFAQTVNGVYNKDNPLIVSGAGASGAGATAAGGGSSGSNVTVNGSRGRYQAPAMGFLPSGPCTGVSGGVSVGAGFAGVGVQGGGIDAQCTLRENIRVAIEAAERGYLNPEIVRRMLEQLDGAPPRIDPRPPVYDAAAARH